MIIKKETRLIITAVEPNAQHGTGNYLREICPQAKGVKYIFYRAVSIYNNMCDVDGVHKIIPNDINLNFLEYCNYKIFKPKRVLVCPYFEKNIDFALYLKNNFNPKIITYLLDDQNIGAKKISDTKLRELFRISQKIYCISEEMQKAYTSKFKIKCEVLFPKLINRIHYIQNEYRFFKSAKTNCALIGNIWDMERLNEISRMCQKNKLQTTWFGYGPDAPWLNINIKRLKKSNIEIGGWLPTKELFKKISQLPFVILPAGTLNKQDGRKEITRFSLPSRVFFLGAHTNTPILVLGSKKSALAKFIEKNRFGIAASTNGQIKSAIKKLKNERLRSPFSDSLFKKRGMFFDQNLANKIWD